MTHTQSIRKISKHPIAIAVVLALLMLLSRPFPMTKVIHLADASNAIFFISGLILLPNRFLFGFIGLTVLLDFISIQFFGTSSFCISRAYACQWPAFAALWFSGRLLTQTHYNFYTIPTIITGFSLVQTFAFLITSGSFYFFSGRFPDPTLAGMITRSERYFSGYFLGGFWYIALFIMTMTCLQYLYQNRLASKV